MTDPVADVTMPSEDEFHRDHKTEELLLATPVLSPSDDQQSHPTENGTVLPLLAIAPSSWSLRLSIAVPGGWSMGHPSLVASASGFAMIVGSRNVVRDASGARHVVDAHGIERHANYGVDLDEELQVRSMRLLADLNHPPGHPFAFSTGCRDIQLFHCQGRILVAGHLLDPEHRDAREFALGVVENGAIVMPRVARFPVGYEPGTCLPVSDSAADAVTYVTDAAPMRVLTLDDASGRFAPAPRRRQPSVARRFRRVSSLVDWDDGFLSLVADGAARSEAQPETVYRFVAYDRQFRLSAMTGLFRFDVPVHSPGVGLAMANERVVLVFMQHEQVCLATSIASSDIRGLLGPRYDTELPAAESRMAPPRSATAQEPNAGDDAQSGETTKPRSAPHLTIAATTISGNSEEFIGDALRSVLDWVDVFILIDTGITDRTIEVAREIVGDKLVVRSFPWREDFSAARNAALDFAHEAGADWSVTLDTDERMHLKGVDIRSILAETTEPVLLMPHDSREYKKDRFFRLPANGRFLGATHEAFYRHDADGGGTVTVAHAEFAELPKTAEAFQKKFERDCLILRREIEREPDQPRWHFYLGDALQRLHQYEEAVAAFQHCASLRGWEEEAAWSMFRAAECLVALDRLEEALDACTLGMARHAGLADIPWYAGHIATRLNRPLQAIYWAHLSIANGKFAGIGKTVQRVGWSHPFGLWEGPYDVLRYAYAAIGDTDRAADADRLYHAAAAARAKEPANV